MTVQNNKMEGDIFAKANDFFRLDDAVAAGVDAFFKPIASQQGGTVVVNGREMVITGSNDYLGLTQDPRLKAAAKEALTDFGTSCTGSRLLTGTLTFHDSIEIKLAQFFKKESSLTFSAGFLGCLSVITALVGRNDTMYFDRENHASLYDAARLSYGKLRKYGHNDMEELERLLKADEGKAGGRLIVTDGVFSMSGHIAKLPEIVALAKKYNARILLDDAHGCGVLGETGRGTAEHFGLEDDVDLIVGTFSKSLASVGGFVIGDTKIINWIKYAARPFIFTAALPAMQMAAALKALEILDSEPQHKAKLWLNVKRLQEGMKSLGFNTLGTQTPIVPVFIGDDDTALKVWRALWDEGIFTTPAIAPAVPPNESIIRTSINANHEPEHVDQILNAFEKVGKQFSVI